MGKRKVFVKTDLATPSLEPVRGESGQIAVLPAVVPPHNTVVEFGRNANKARRFDFAPWYGRRVDEITHACQRQIERFLRREDADVEVSTVVGYCQQGLRHFLDYAALTAAETRTTLILTQINRAMIDGYLGYLASKGVSPPVQRTNYSYTKSVLRALARRGLYPLVHSGDNATFPKHPFPNVSRSIKGERPLTKAQRKSFAVAVRSAIQPLFDEDGEPSRTVLAYALLSVALHTGRNTTPLLEMPIDSLRAHPKDGLEFLMLYKRRGHTSSKVVLRKDSASRTVESTRAVRPTVSQLVRRVVHLTRHLRDEAPADIRDRVWLYRSRMSQIAGQVTTLGINTIGEAVNKLVELHDLREDDGSPLRLNISRLRKTFVNRIYELLDGDVAATAAAAGNSVTNTMRHYLRPSTEAENAWCFMGTTLVTELLTGTLGATERTPVGRCSDKTGGEYAPKRDGKICQSFLNCLRCRNYVVTGDDLWRLYSFYWRILRERPRVGKRRWERHLAHIPRLIERDVIAQGLARRVFKQKQVDAARERARRDPHPFWAGDAIIEQLGVLS